ncbi:MAG: hypothetical protein AAGD01_08185 [Acidobacteriota bacterium]
MSEAEKSRARRWLDSLLAKADIAILRKSTLDELVEFNRYANSPDVSLPPGAAEVLRGDHPRLQDLISRYRDHPAAPSLWSQEFLARSLKLTTFRGDNAYIWQLRGLVKAAQYALTTHYLEKHDPLGLLDTLEEDGLFGAFTFDIDGRIVSRDLLDSVVELNYLHQVFKARGLDLHRPGLRFLDIGAGYGRLAHRATTAFPNLHYLCTDAVPQSTFLCDYYLTFRGAEQTQILPLDQVREALLHDLQEQGPLDLAINIHSFSEAPLAAITWWIDLLAEAQVQRLLIVPNTGQDLLSTEADEERLDFRPVIEERGFQLENVRAKFEHSDAVQRYGVFPSWYFLFGRG